MAYTDVTLSVQVTIEHSSDKEYENKLNTIISKLEEECFSADVESEEELEEG